MNYRLSAYQGLVTIGVLVTFLASPSQSTASSTCSSPLNFGHCSNPGIVYGYGLDGSSQNGYAPADQSQFPHGFSPDIADVESYICSRLEKNCHASSDAVQACLNAFWNYSGLSGHHAVDEWNAALGVGGDENSGSSSTDRTVVITCTETTTTTTETVNPTPAPGPVPPSPPPPPPSPPSQSVVTLTTTDILTTSLSSPTLSTQTDTQIDTLTLTSTLSSPSTTTSTPTTDGVTVATLTITTTTSTTTTAGQGTGAPAFNTDGSPFSNSAVSSFCPFHMPGTALGVVLLTVLLM